MDNPMLNLNPFDTLFTPSPVRKNLPWRRRPNLLNARTLEALLLPGRDEMDYPRRVDVYHTLLTHDVLLPLPAAGSPRFSGQILTLENEGGERGLPAFTDENAFLLWSRKVGDLGSEFSAAGGLSGFTSLPFSTVCGIAVETGADWLILNAAGPVGGEIARCELLYLADSLVPPPVPAEGATDAAV
jgi:hypothetical protein